MQQSAQIESTVEEIFNLYEVHGASAYAGEKVSQLEHMCQAAEFAIKGGCDDEVVLAAFLHDIGHLLPVSDKDGSMQGYGNVDHEKLGATYLRSKGFSERVCSLIASHVNAKRYLTYKDPDYYSRLSEASRKTLDYQGGRMEAAEADRFVSDPLFELFIKMRLWDETAKVEQQPIPALDLFRKKALVHLHEQQTKHG